MHLVGVDGRESMDVFLPPLPYWGLRWLGVLSLMDLSFNGAALRGRGLQGLESLCAGRCCLLRGSFRRKVTSSTSLRRVLDIFSMSRYKQSSSVLCTFCHSP